MQTATDLLVELTRCGISLQAADGLIRYKAPQGALTPDLRRDLAAHKPEILRMYSGDSISDALNRVADLWCADIESQGEGDAAWTWIKASDYWVAISAAEDVVNRIAKNCEPDDLNAACHSWLSAWVDAIAEWRERCCDINRTEIFQPGAVQSKKRA